MTRRYQRKHSREQLGLFPEALDERISDDNPVRAIDAYVDTLDLVSLDFTNVTSSSNRGQPPFDPASLLKLYLYGYMNGVRSSRKLEKECQRNLEVIWLMEKQQPSYKTIANFRKDNPEAMVKVNRDFLLLCRSLNLVSQDLVAIDGSFFQGNASLKSIRTHKGLRDQIRKLEERIRQYHESLDAEDQDESQHSTDGALPDKLKRLLDEKARVDQALQTLESSDERQLSDTDPDARRLFKNGQKTAGYNVQVAVEEDNQLIVASDVTNDANDQRQLHSMASQAKDALEADQLTVLSDAGYFEQSNIKQCQDDDILPYVPEPNKQRVIKDAGRYGREDFIYDSEADCYRCPAGKFLSKTGQGQRKNNKLRNKYTSTKADCDQCPLRQHCLASKSRTRQIYRWEHEDRLDEHRQRMEAEGPVRMRQRAALVEHVFGTLKTRMGWTHFLVRGFRKVRGEWSLAVVGYNLTRVLNILGTSVFLRFCEYLKELILYLLFWIGRCYRPIPNDQRVSC